MIDKIKEFRVKLDGITNLTKSLDPQESGTPSRTREISLTITSLELSKMWLGKVLKELGNANPYPESKNPTSEKIEPTADKYSIRKLTLQDNNLKEYFSVTNAPNINWMNVSHIQKVKFLRAEIEKIEDQISKISVVGMKLQIAITSSYNNCLEAGMWLGMELGRVRDTQEQEK